MKLVLTISKELKEEKISIEAHELTPALRDIINRAKGLGKPDRLTVKRGKNYIACVWTMFYVSTLKIASY